MQTALQTELELAATESSEPSAGHTSPMARIVGIKTELANSPYSICLERPALLRRFAQSPEGKQAQQEHPLVRRAKAIAFLLANRTPRIYENELIIGNMTSKRIAANYYPEGGSINILEDILSLDKRRIPLVLTLGEKLQLLSYGLGDVFKSVGGRSLLKPGRVSHFLDFFVARRYIITEEAGIAHQVGDYHMVVHKGLASVDQCAADCLKENRLPDGTAMGQGQLGQDQRAFYQSQRLVISGIAAMASNLAAEAERIAETHKMPAKRKAELLTAAATCRRVPLQPARTFLEGLQACWLVHLALNQEDFEQGLSFGRLDQILFPLYQREIAQGSLTSQAALEILASFQLKTCETIPLYSERIDQYFSGNGVAQGITVGGVDAEGHDVTNELSSLILEAYGHICTREPALHVRVHSKTPPEFLKQAAAIAQLGSGKPSFFGDQAVIRALQSAGMTEQHARDYAVIGCVEMASQGRTYNSSDAALFNLPLCLELALNRGYPLADSKRLTGRLFSKRLGAATPDVAEMVCFEDVLSALKMQVEDAVAEMSTIIGWLEDCYRTWRPTPVNSMVTQGCLQSGRDVTWGGGLYDLTSIQAAGLADMGDSLYAIKQLVFVEKRLSLSQLVQILGDNYANNEPLRQELLHKFPRYGNGIAEVDQMTQVAADIFSDVICALRNTRGGRYVPGFYSMTCHIGFGKLTGALPNGRLAGSRLSNGLSPVDGLDRQGPTAMLRSAASLDSSRWSNCCALNMKLEQSSLRGDVGQTALAGLLQTYLVDLGGMQVQANVVDHQTLQQAKQDPDAFPGLVVRVAGYCAYFNDLQPDVQDEIIARTSHGVG